MIKWELIRGHQSPPSWPYTHLPKPRRWGRGKQAGATGSAMAGCLWQLKGASDPDFLFPLPVSCLACPKKKKKNIDRTGLRVHLVAAVFPAVDWPPPPSLSKPALDSSSSREPGQSVVIVGKLANTGAKENKDQL